MSPWKSGVSTGNSTLSSEKVSAVAVGPAMLTKTTRNVSRSAEWSGGGSIRSCLSTYASPGASSTTNKTPPTRDDGTTGESEPRRAGRGRRRRRRCRRGGWNVLGRDQVLPFTAYVICASGLSGFCGGVSVRLRHGRSVQLVLRTLRLTLSVDRAGAVGLLARIPQASIH